MTVRIMKRYRKNTALVIRDTSGIDWDWDLVITNLKEMLGSGGNPFDRGIWIVNRFKHRVFRIT